MITYFKMKQKERRIKLALYTYLLDLMDEKEDILSMLANLISELSTSPMEELRDTFIKSIAELAHEQAQKERDEK